MFVVGISNLGISSLSFISPGCGHDLLVFQQLFSSPELCRDPEGAECYDFLASLMGCLFKGAFGKEQGNIPESNLEIGSFEVFPFLFASKLS